MPKALAQRIAELDPTDERGIAAAAVAAARRAAAAPHSGRKALEALRRHAAKKNAHPDVVQHVIQMAEPEFERLRREATQSKNMEPPAVAWLTIEATADAFGESPHCIRGWLRTVNGRTRLGWPWWDGHIWRIPEPAVNPMTRASYMATLPEREPPAHTATLPSWCERASDQSKSAG